MGPLLDYLREVGIVAPEPAGPVTAIDELVENYREWLLVERGLAPSTIRSSERLARRFLAEQISAQVATGPVAVTGVDVTGFLVRESERVSPRSAGCVACQLRSLLRYLAARGLADPGLVDAVPRIALWRDSAIPQFPAPAAVDALLASCDRSTVVGARDYAVLMLLARLGLRAIEVSRLELTDLDWRAGEIELDGKAHERGRLPLPTDVGEALVAYLPGPRRDPPAGVCDRSWRQSARSSRAASDRWSGTPTSVPVCSRLRLISCVMRLPVICCGRARRWSRSVRSCATSGWRARRSTPRSISNGSGPPRGRGRERHDDQLRRACR